MVAYLRVPPPDEQRDVVEHYWMVEAPGSADVRREILIPNGRPALAIALAEPGRRHDPVTGTEWINDASLFGIMTRPHVLTQSGPSSYAGVEFKPWGVAALGVAGGLLGGPSDAAATLAALHGYYDQAHAARDFKRYTGVSASSFREVQHGIAALMHERSVQDATRSAESG
ncbi:DUF6597 domain-containing transcriptional factor [Kribbella sp. NPDC023972]|uniref:DUF6597 domain-containing transcriptional factor n=1 Tax=Kribbella sp. NPDC023972 TaxID=3154795 RepID=UPI0033FC4CE9